MQNLKSISNLHQKPVMGANDDTLAMVGRNQVGIYSYEDETMDMVRKLKEPQRSLLTKQLLTDSQQD